MTSPTSTERRTRVVILFPDHVGPHMAGSGIRYWELARVLSQTCDVTLAAHLEEGASAPAWRLVSLDPGPEALEALLAGADVIVGTGDLLRAYPSLAHTALPWVVDAYVPTPTESLAMHSLEELRFRMPAHATDLGIYSDALARGDFILCSSERHRDFVLGFLAAIGRVNPYTYDDDPALRRLVDVVPFGLPAEPPVCADASLDLPGIGADRRIIYWGGGIWNWFDPLTLVRAMVWVAQAEPRACLLLPGGQYPLSGAGTPLDMLGKTRALSDTLGLTGRHVLFTDWVPYAQRATYLLRAEVGASLHPAGVEARYAYRTRLLDYFWTGLPMVVTEGDMLADLVAARGLGRVVRPGDVDGVADAILALLAEPDARATRAEAFREVAAQMTWERNVQPLVRFCLHPSGASDREAGYISDSGAPGTARITPQVEALRRENKELRDLVGAYERGRFMRAMAALKGWKRRLLGGGRA
ncbi:MAG: glycosyltransferase family 4 protein [Anaerolineae bacterium]